MTNPTKKQTIHVIATCQSEAQAREFAEKYKTFNGVVGFEILGNVLTLICNVVRDQALVVYGKLKDALPGYCNCSCKAIPT